MKKQIKKFLSILLFPFELLGIVAKQKKVDFKDGKYHPQIRRHRDLVNYFLNYGFDKQSKILDVGCGNGWLIQRLKKNGFTNIEGCDWIDLNSTDFKYQKIDLNADGLCYYKNSHFDIVIASDVVEHLENPSYFFRESHRILKKNGNLIITLPNCHNIYQRILFFLTGNSSRYRSERKSKLKWSHISMLPDDILDSLTNRTQFQLVNRLGGYAFFFGFFWKLPKIPYFSFNIMYHYKK